MLDVERWFFFRVKREREREREKGAGASARSRALQRGQMCTVRMANSERSSAERS